jgi:hypothetical protein
MPRALGQAVHYVSYLSSGRYNLAAPSQFTGSPGSLLSQSLSTAAPSVQKARNLFGNLPGMG